MSRYRLKSASSWWREDGKIPVDCPMFMLVSDFMEWMGGWDWAQLDECLGFDVDETDAAMEQYWAIQEGYA